MLSDATHRELALNPSQGTVVDGATSINDILPNEALLKIFAHVPFVDRHNSLPLVCRSWQQLSLCSAIWGEVQLDHVEELAKFTVLYPTEHHKICSSLSLHLHQSPSFLKWLSTVAHEVHTFSFRGASRLSWSVEWFARVFDLLPSSLHSLSISFSACYQQEEFLALPFIPQKFAALRELKLTSMARLNHCQIQALSVLTSLESLTLEAYRSGIYYNYPWHPPLHPLPHELSALTALTHLSVATHHLMFSMQAPEFIGNLPRLSSLILHNCRPENVVSGLPCWTALQALELGDDQTPASLLDVWTELVPPLPQLPQLTSLTFSGRLVPYVVTEDLSVLVGLQRLVIRDSGSVVKKATTLPGQLSLLTNLRHLSLPAHMAAHPHNTAVLLDMPWVECVGLLGEDVENCTDGGALSG